MPLQMIRLTARTYMTKSATWQKGKDPGVPQNIKEVYKIVTKRRRNISSEAKIPTMPI